MNKNKKVILIILDGWGIGKKDKFNAIDNAQTPNINYLLKNYPNTEVFAHGVYAGLPKNNFGTSETNHQIIGAGFIPKSSLLKINEALEKDLFKNNPQFSKVIEHCIKNNSDLHLGGIISDGGVHSDIKHLIHILEKIKEINFTKNVYIHGFTDGRDTPPLSAIKYFEKIQKTIEELDLKEIVKFSTIQGRFYLDRDRDWDKTEEAIDLIFDKKGIKKNNWKEAIEYDYSKMIESKKNDQYVNHYYLEEKGNFKTNDTFLCFNFRTDRIYQLLKKLEEKSTNKNYITGFIKPSEELNFEPLFYPDKVDLPLSKILAKHNKTQLHTSETEKFAHVTYFFNGQEEKLEKGEKHKLVKSNGFIKPYYNLEPSMKSEALTKLIIEKVNNKDKKECEDFILINYPNLDMVGHTGNYNASVIAAENIDYCIGLLYENIKDKLEEFTVIITADHGNSEEMWDYKNDQPHTQHTFNKVPLIIIDKDIEELKTNKNEEISLKDIAPTILKYFNIEIPASFTGKSLI